ncbi:4Fe-4S binding protein [Pukyongiella litopenaei]|uniref:4Fe-4S binding protein n=1 Tax=Pukyongiella litopenaei TaxID=2605946 RepID=A0A2S0MQW1_9RHOB|nr:4Fe-4S binding protein [Pukyongiella litopenaei]AVO38226.1 4Fe-4S binding protein [Pukyongiella litopenaei]
MSAYRTCVAILALVLLQAFPAWTEPLARAQMSELVVPPYSLGDPLNDRGVWTLLNSGGAEAGYVFETGELAPLPGFSGVPINLFVMLDSEGRFIDVRLIEHNEPIFVSGLGEAPFHAFFEQYAGLSISSSIVVGTPYGDGRGESSLVYLDGVTKATASVRIAHESILAATLAVAREKMRGLAADTAARPDPELVIDLTWDDLLAEHLVARRTVTNAEADAAFAETIWADDDPEAGEKPEETYLGLWAVDIGPPSIARAVLSNGTFAELQRFLELSPEVEPFLLIDTGRHGLVSDEFVRNTAPDRIYLEQDGLPVALRDADLIVELADGVPDGTAMILRTDRRLGFDPAREWTLQVQAVREHGMFQPEIGSVMFEVTHATDERFFLRDGSAEPTPPWLEAIRNRLFDLVVLVVFLAVLGAVLFVGMNRLAVLERFTPLRLGILGFVIVFVGWWGQGQLSIVTVLATLRSAVEGGSLAYLIYDPFSLLIWVATIIGFVLWGRGFFCGWLCPFGAMQEFMHHLGARMRLPRIDPPARWDRRLKAIKYVLLAGLVVTVFVAPDHVDTAAEIEPFKTAVTVYFLREWYYVLYAGFWLGLGLFLFKGFCRYVCPLGAFMAIGGLLRGRDWIARRAECGDPCQLCRVRCKYGAIGKRGKIEYSECFQCLDCVTIHQDIKQCVPLVLAARQARNGVAAK